MVFFAVTGATRGIGFGFVKHLSQDVDNQVVALIRNRATAGPLEQLASQRKNIQIIVTDISSPSKLREAARETSQFTGRALDVLILNAGAAGSYETNLLAPSAFHGKEDKLDEELNDNIKWNLTSNIYVTNAFLDLIRHGESKKILFMSSPSGDVEFTRITGMGFGLGYAVAKAGMNMIMTKFAIELAEEGIKTLSLSPGWVDTEGTRQASGHPEFRRFVLQAFHKLNPTVREAIPVEESVTSMLAVLDNMTQEDSGKFLTHRGNNVDWF